MDLNEYCSFGEQRVYLMMAIARKKENPNITSNGEIVFREVVKNQKDISRKKEKLRNACKNYARAEKFRLYFSVNARNTEKAYFRFRERMNGWIEDKLNGQKDVSRKLKRVDNHWKSELQKPHSRDETFFLYDLDTEDYWARQELKQALNNKTKIKAIKNTPNGTHFIVEPFNHTEMADFDFDVERHNDRMVFLEYLN